MAHTEWVTCVTGAFEACEGWSLFSWTVMSTGSSSQVSWVRLSVITCSSITNFFCFSFRLLFINVVSLALTTIVVRQIVSVIVSLSNRISSLSHFIFFYFSITVRVLSGMWFQLSEGTHIQVTSQSGQVLWHHVDQLWECWPLLWVHVPALEHNEVAVRRKIVTEAKGGSTALIWSS